MCCATSSSGGPREGRKRVGKPKSQIWCDNVVCLPLFQLTERVFGPLQVNSDLEKRIGGIGDRFLSCLRNEGPSMSNPLFGLHYLPDPHAPYRRWTEDNVVIMRAVHGFGTK
jgi:hypothetical protein